jgi:signal transduction histidine kinase
MDVGDERYEPSVEATLYYIAAEALTNVAKHADATVARVVVKREGESLRLEITDDGCGGADPATGTGILGLHDRASAIGGSLVVVSSPGRGTTLTGTVPLSR